LPKRNLLIALALLAAAGIGFLLGRQTGHSGLVTPDTGPALVTWRGGSAGLSAVKAALAQEPASLRSPKVARGVVEELVRARVLAGLAVEKGYDRDPELARRYAEQLASLYLEKEFEAPERSKGPTEEEVRAFFERHKGELSRPERARVAAIGIRAAKPSELSASRARAQSVLAEARAREGDYYAFGELARRRSEEPRTAAHQGELPFMTREELAAAIGPEGAEAAFGMSEQGKVRPTLVEGRGGFWILKLLGREAAQEPTFEAVRDGLRVRLASERREERRKAFLDEVWKRAAVQVDDEKVERLVAELRASGR
jgi:parvulin-like peptidyl-prolyl isomerase